MTPAGVEERLNCLEHELARVKAITEILNLVNQMQWLHSVNRDNDITNLLARESPDVRVYMSKGYLEGPEEVAKPARMRPVPNPGHMALHLMSNPIIEVAGDGKTAKGVWIACGMVAMKDKKTNRPAGYWEWNRYGIDFIKENGQWKIWHHHVFPLFCVGWNEKWEDQFKPEDNLPLNIPAEFRPNHPPTPLDVGYSPDTELPYIAPPEPYETFDPKTMY